MIYKIPKKLDCRNNQAGFTLVELIIVLVIVGILATQVVSALTSDATKVKGAAFRMRGDFNLARSEAVNRNEEVIVTFQIGAVDGYRIWIDDNPAGGDDAYTAGSDTLIKDMTFDSQVQLYDTDCSGDGGPALDGATKGVAKNPPVGSDGVTFVTPDDEFKMMPNGTSNNNGTVYLYVPDPANPAVMRAAPFAAIMGNNCRVRLVRWRKDLAAWSTK
jgi:prepilin-type N-terminal cleavage/methylation domain-containing protein